MTKQEFESKRDTLDAQIGKLQDEIKAIEQQYVEENSLYKIGDRVKISDNKSSFEAQITHRALRYASAIGYYFSKINKDGTVSKTVQYLYSYQKVEKL